MNTFEEAFTARKLGDSSLRLKNVFIRSAAYEGMFDQGIPSQDLIDHHVAMARALIHDSDFLIKLKNKQIEKTECNRCNLCVVEMDRGGVKCVL